MLRTSVVASALLLSSCANAFYDSVPFVTWSNRPSSAIQSLPDHLPHVPSQAQVMNLLMGGDDLCAMDVVVIIGQPGLHASKLAALSSESNLKTRIQRASSKAHFPFIPISTVVDASSIARDVAAFCGVSSNEWTPGRVIEGDVKHVLYFELPESTERFWGSTDETLEQNIDEISSRFADYAVILTGTTSGATSPLVLKRQQPNSLSAPGFTNQPVTGFAPSNATLPTGGILARYQLLTPGLLTALLIAFGLLIPLLMIGINALASIQNPIRTEAPKGPTLEKKNQ
ncbi:hypothetical protein BDV93DRAFT_548320 [Ceratobasidium sp. AG-I]|nr:hypothetical protein BDV93DRAFT_548320 [Ceratobasidium sp. AG-I]